MALPTIQYADQWGECIDHPAHNCVEIRWYDTTSGMEGEDFNHFLLEFASAIEHTGRTAALVDAVQFKMDMTKMSIMPAIGAEPKNEGPADFPTAYFATRAEALAWFNQ